MFGSRGTHCQVQRRSTIFSCVNKILTFAISGCYLWLYVFLSLVIPIEGLFKVLRDTVVERLRQNPFYWRFLSSLKRQKTKYFLVIFLKNKVNECCTAGADSLKEQSAKQFKSNTQNILRIALGCAVVLHIAHIVLEDVIFSTVHGVRILYVPFLDKSICFATCLKILPKCILICK